MKSTNGNSVRRWLMAVIGGLLIARMYGLKIGAVSGLTIRLVSDPLFWSSLFTIMRKVRDALLHFIAVVCESRDARIARLFERRQDQETGVVGYDWRAPIPPPTPPAWAVYLLVTLPNDVWIFLGKLAHQLGEVIVTLSRRLWSKLHLGHVALALVLALLLASALFGAIRPLDGFVDEHPVWSLVIRLINSLRA